MDVSALENLTNLTFLKMPANIKDLEPLRNLTNLTTLNLQGGYSSRDTGGFRSLEPLRGLRQLSSLYIASQTAMDLSPLGDLTNLQTLSFVLVVSSSDTFLDLTPLGKLTKLTSLEISNVCRVGSLEPLRGLTELKTFTFSIWGMDKLDLSPVAHVPTVNIQ